MCKEELNYEDEEDDVISYEVEVPIVFKAGLNIFAKTKEEAIETAIKMIESSADWINFHEMDLEKLKHEIICEESEYC